MAAAIGDIDTNALWRANFGEKERPKLYTSGTTENGFLPLSDPQNFVADLDGMTNDQLWALGHNNCVAMLEAQNEYNELSELIANMTGNITVKNAQRYKDSDEFEERKEATLYQFRYEAPRPQLNRANIDDITEYEKHEVRMFQEPFEQGGFVPTNTQYKAKLAKAKDPRNIDGWKPTEKNGRMMVPKQQVHRPEYEYTLVRREMDENGEFIRPVSPDSEDGEHSPTKPINKRLTRTRFDGKKVPPTRDVSEAPTVVSTNPRSRQGTPKRALEDGDSPAPKRARTVLNVDGKPKHHNQYTKAKEREALALQQQQPQQQQQQWQKSHNQLQLEQQVERPMPLPQQPPPPPPQQQHQPAVVAKKADKPRSTTKPDMSAIDKMSVDELRAKKGWQDDELLEAVRRDFSWLHPDPIKASNWRDNILSKDNPVRTYSMLKKWAQWQATGKAKRPRKRGETPGRDETPGTDGEVRVEKPATKKRKSESVASDAEDNEAVPAKKNKTMNGVKEQEKPMPSPLKKSFRPDDIGGGVEDAAAESPPAKTNLALPVTKVTDQDATTDELKPTTNAEERQKTKNELDEQITHGLAPTPTTIVVNDTMEDIKQNTQQSTKQEEQEINDAQPTTPPLGRGKRTRKQAGKRSRTTTPAPLEPTKAEPNKPKKQTVGRRGRTTTPASAETTTEPEPKAKKQQPPKRSKTSTPSPDTIRVATTAPLPAPVPAPVPAPKMNLRSSRRGSA